MANDVIDGSLPMCARAVMIHVFEEVHGPLCARFRWFCRPWARQRDIYRAVDDGEWKWQGAYFNADDSYTPVTATKRVPTAASELPFHVARAKQFFDALHADQRCIVLTGVPNPYSQAEDWAAGIASALSLNVVLPKVGGLMTFDDSHLNARSAERWSSAFLEGFDPFLTACLHASS